MNNFCQEHGNQSITHICTFNHDCQKRMCPDCQYTHQQIVPGEKIIPITKFIEKMSSTISQYDSITQSKIEKEMKMKFEKILEQIYKLSQKAQENFCYIFGEIQQRDNSYLELFRKDPLEISLKDLNKITNIWHYTIFEKWQKQKEILIEIVEKKVNLIYNSIGKFTMILENQIHQWIEEKSTNIDHESPFSYESIQFPVHFGIRHGQTFTKRLGTFEEYGQIKLNQNLNILNQKGFALNKKKLKLTEFQIKILQDDGYLQYLRDGVVLKAERISNINQSLLINKNLEQVQHLSWQGSYGQELQKVGLWNAFWQGKKLDIGGKYGEDGFKKDQWIELSNIYQSQCQVTETGSYQQGRKIGKWQTIYKGSRMQLSLKHLIEEGDVMIRSRKKRQEFGKKFTQILISLIQSLLIVNVKYFIKENIQMERSLVNGKFISKMIPLLNIREQEVGFMTIKIIGSRANGKSFIINIKSRKFCYPILISSFEFIQRGVYERGRREGRWDIYHSDIVIGGGYYGQTGKSGKWIEPLTNQITSEGSYQNGQRIGQWALQLMGETIGGGLYDQNGLKINSWTEINEKYNKGHYINYIGEYKDGKKIGEWNIQNNRDQIGGGPYEDGLKSGEWIEIHENFQDNFQIITVGEYDKGKKSGIWTLKLRQPPSTEFVTIGGGNYNGGLKTGEWIDLDQNYQKTNQVIYYGKYREGKKVQIWDIKTNNIRIGGGTYLITGEKDGEWIELDDNFRDLCQIINKGVYQNGKKVGTWVIQLIEEEQRIVNLGGGRYDNYGRQIELWIELYQNFWKLNILRNIRECRVIFQGEYQDGKKQGIWQSFFQQDSNQAYVKFGGGYYNKGLKDGPWIEFQEKIWNPQQYLIVSQYNNGIKQKQNQ